MSKPQNAPKPPDAPKPEAPKDTETTSAVQSGPPAPVTALVPAPPAEPGKLQNPFAPEAPKAPPREPTEEEKADSARRKAEDEAYERLLAKRRELEALRMQAEEKKLDEEIQALKYPGLSQIQILNNKKSEAIRAATFKETGKDGVVMAVYRLPEQSYKGGQLRPAGYIYRLPIDKLPGPTWEAVKKVPAGPATEFTPV